MILICVNQKSILVLRLFSNAVLQRLFLPPVKYFFIIGFLLLVVRGSTQSTDSLNTADTLQVDTTISPVVTDTIRPILQFPFISDSFLYRKRLFFSFTDPIRYTISEKSWQGKEPIFYSIIGLLLFLAFAKNSFPRYFSDLYSSYFRTTMRQRQVKEQLLQNPLPSLLFNIFFLASTAIFLSLIIQYYGLANNFSFWMLAAYSALGLALIYGGKFLALKFFGWVFQMTEATDTYIFIVFSTNKIIGVSMLPFTTMLAFTYGAVNAAAVTLSLIVIGALFAYRYFLSFISINRMVRIGFFHFLIYLAAFEVLPLLLINKLLFTILREIT